MNAQEIFNTVAQHLITQGKPAHDPRTATCYYRFNGLKCAVGALIPDELYDAEMECRSVSELRTAFPALKPILPHLELLTDLQKTHDAVEIRKSDGTYDLLALTFRLKRIAEANKLDTQVLA